MTAEHPGVRVRLLGPVSARRGEKVLPLGSARRLAVFSMLALHANQSVSRAELINAVWGEDAPASATGNVYTYVSELRRALEPSRDRWSAGQILTSGGGSYCLHVVEDDIDVMQMYALFDKSRSQRITGDVAGQLASIETGLALWHGEALAGVPGPHAAAQRLRLAELRLTGQERYATLLIEVGRYDQAIAMLRRLVGDHPLRENMHGLLMTALHRDGRRGEALQMYHDLRELLIEETGSEPGEALRQMHDQVVGGKSGVPAEPADPTPAPATTVVGRGPLLDRLRRAVTELAGGRGGSVWFDGEPGIGKTALLVEGLRNVAAVGARRGWASGDALAQRRPLSLLLDCLDGSDLDEPARTRLSELRDETGNSAIERTVALVRDVCATGPLVLVVDDLHWSDESTLLAWRSLHQLTRHLPLLLVAAGRPATRNRSLALLRRVVAEQGAETLHVGPLDDAEAIELAGRLAPDLTRPALDQAVADAAGNPYYLRHLVAAEGLHPALVAAVGAHLDAYGEDTRHILRTIAFLGDGCTVTEVAAVTGRPMPDLMRAGQETLAAGLLVSDAGPQLAFRHPVVRRVLHEGTPTALRVMLHRAVAEKIAETGGSPERVVAQLLAGPVPIDAWAGRWLAANVEQLAARAPDQAIAILRRATPGAITETAIRESLTAWLARVLFWQGDGADSEAGWVAARSADPDLVAEMRWIVALSHHRRAEHVAAVDGILAALRDGAIPERWQERYRLLLARLTPYVAGAVAGTGPVTIMPTVSADDRISVIR
jgi:DNA-binding SARP family transcriptional activator